MELQWAYRRLRVTQTADFDFLGNYCCYPLRNLTIWQTVSELSESSVLLVAMAMRMGETLHHSPRNAEFSN